LEAPSEIVIRPGTTYRVVLGGLGSAGYLWEFEVEGSPGVIAVHPDFSTQKETMHPNHSTLQTSSVEHLFTIEALKPGQAEVRFLLRRPWQKDTPPVRTMAVHVTVPK
jgi:predicted secreted protein